MESLTPVEILILLQDGKIPAIKAVRERLGDLREAKKAVDAYSDVLFGGSRMCSECHGLGSIQAEGPFQRETNGRGILLRNHCVNREGIL